METTIKTLNQLAELINAAEDYPVAVVEETIKANNWLDTSGRDDYSICSDGEYYLVLDDNDGRAVVRLASYDEEQQKQKIVSNNLQFGRDLAEMRTRQGLSLLQLQNLCGVDNASISRIETGKYNPSVAVVNRILEPMGARLTITID